MKGYIYRTIKLLASIYFVLIYEHGCDVVIKKIEIGVLSNFVIDKSIKIEEEEEEEDDVYSWRLPGTNNYFGTQIGARAMDLQICQGQ